MQLIRKADKRAGLIVSRRRKGLSGREDLSSCPRQQGKRNYKNNKTIRKREKGEIRFTGG